MKKHKYPRCTCHNNDRDPRCQFHNKLDALLKLHDPSQSAKDTINEMRELASGRAFRREPFTVEEVLEQRASKNKGRPHKTLTHNPFAKLREMR